MKGWIEFNGSLAEYLLSIPQEQWKETYPLYGDTFLHMAVRLNDFAVVKMLLPLHLNTQEKNGCTPLHCACSFARSELVHMLCKANANMQIKNENGLTPLEECFRCNHIHCAQILMLHGCRLSSQNFDVSIHPNLRKLESLILKHRSLVCSFLCIAKKKKRDYRWDRFLLYVLARQVWELRFEAL